jgi:predicted phosphodiesterase
MLDGLLFEIGGRVANLTFLHVSDLHYEPKKDFDRGIVIEALLADVRQWRSQGTQFDAVIFSGDLVQTGDNNFGFAKVVDAFIDPLLQATDLERDKLILCPGNHDIKRDAVESILEDGLLANLKTVRQINDFIENALRAPTLATKAALARMQPYETFYAKLGLGAHKSDNIFFKTRILTLAGYKVGFASLNSAWRATGAPDDKDKNKLILGERAIDLAIADLGDADFRLCVSHHPLEWLLDSDSTAIENRLYDAFDLVCFGHTHRPNPRQIVSPLATTVISQSGSIYATRRWFNGYHIIEWNADERKITFKSRMYLDNPRRAFVAAENISPGGSAEFTLKAHANKAQLAEIELFLRQGRATIRDAANEHISFARAEDGKKVDFGEAFVCQPLLSKLETKDLITPATQDDYEKRERTADEILRYPGAVALLGESECGRTSLLHHLAIRASEGVCDQSRVPAIVSVPLAVKNGYEKTIRAYYTNSDFKIGTLSRAVRTLRWIVFLDDFDAGRKGHLELVGEIIEKFPAHRIVVSTNELSLGNLRDKLTNNGLMSVEIGFLPRKSIRQLSRIRFTRPLDTGMDDPAYLLVMKHLNESRLPRTGYMVALLLWAAEQQTLGRALNEAVLLENLISFLLGKTNFEAALRNQFDPRAQEFLLRAIAVKLRDAGNWADSNDLLEFIIEYFKTRGLRHGAKEVLEEFIACKLLVERGGHIAFRYSCYQEYFIAFDLKQDPKRLQTLLAYNDPEKILSYGRELDLWSSLSRELQGADVALLSLLHGAGLDVADANGDLGDVKFAGRELRFKPQRVQQLLENPPTKDELDEIMDKMENARTGKRKEPEKASETGAAEDSKEKEAEPHLTSMTQMAHQRSALKILAKILRNCDQEKLEKKKSLVETLLRLWSAHTCTLLEMISEIIDDEISKRSVDSKSTPMLTRQDLLTFTNVFKLVMAFADASEVASNLTSDSLRKPMEDLARNAEEREGARFFAACAYAESWDDKGIKLARDVLRDLKSNVLKHAALQKMLHDYRFQNYRTASVDAFRGLIVETEMALHGVTDNTERGMRMATLVEQAKDDIGQ